MDFDWEVRRGAPRWALSVDLPLDDMIYRSKAFYCGPFDDNYHAFVAIL
jgi:hypothetical protein